jgi:hypothetical protein
MLNKSVNVPLFRLIELNNLILQMSNRSCFDSSYTKLIQDYRNVSWTFGSDPVLNRLWLWQTCNQFANFFTTSSTNQPFFPFLPLE